MIVKEDGDIYLQIDADDLTNKNDGINWISHIECVSFVKLSLNFGIQVLLKIKKFLKNYR